MEARCDLFVYMMFLLPALRYVLAMIFEMAGRMRSAKRFSDLPDFAIYGKLFS